ncbi:MAG: membrane protease YdiL (CAAX protease family) [Roseivirga sp.]|jgi:membrane protease YdiL (CAAX protease family)
MYNSLRSKSKIDKSYLFDFKVVLLAGLIKIAYTAIFSYLIIPENGQLSAAQLSPFGENSIVISLSAVIIIPALETFLFQFGVIEIGLQLNKSRKSKLIALLVSSLLFGLVHYTSASFFFVQILSGAIYASLYLFAKSNCKTHAYLITFIVHAGHNFVGYLINEVFHL